MCKTKTSTAAIEPSKSTSRRRSNARRSSFHSSSYSNTTSSGAATRSTLVSSSSQASASSLSSIRSSLPQNPLIYNFSEISLATNALQSHRLSPSSWRCSLRGRDVVVFQRRIRRPLDLPRLLSSLCKSHHSSIADLLSATVSGDHVYLVYDFVPGASLSDCLRNPKNPSFTVLSTWISRMQVIADLADGLLYIHRHAGPGLRLIHNHFKSSSVIISDPSLQAKICHFGTAQLTGELPEDQIQEIGEIQEIGSDRDHSSSGKLEKSSSGVMKMQGTRGYMPPEFLTEGMVSQKSDVYAFGVVVLELLSGEEPLKYRLGEEGGGYRRVSLIESAAEVVQAEGGLRRWIDRRLKDSFPMDTAEKVAHVALECVDEDPEKRPDMERVAGRVSMLYLESKVWAETMRIPTDFTVSMAPR